MFKKVALYTMGCAVNGCLLFKSVEANNRWNQYLKNLPPEELEKLKARDWYLRKNKIMFNTGDCLLDKIGLSIYQGLSEEEKEAILIQYRWAVVQEEESRRSGPSR